MVMGHQSKEKRIQSEDSGSCSCRSQGATGTERLPQYFSEGTRWTRKASGFWQDNACNRLVTIGKLICSFSAFISDSSNGQKRAVKQARLPLQSAPLTEVPSHPSHAHKKM